MSTRIGRPPGAGGDAAAGDGAEAAATTDPVRLLRDALERESDGLLTCVHCGFCLPACPTYRRLGDEADSPRGRLHLMRAVAEGRLDPASDAFQVHLDRCLGCRACEPVCPSGVPYGALLEEARAVARSRRPPHLLARILPALLAASLPRRAAMLLGRLLRRTGLPARIARRAGERRRPPGPVGWGMGMLAASAPADDVLRAAPDDAPGSAAPSPTGADRTRRASPAPSQEASLPRPGAGPPHSGRGPATVACLDGCVQEGLYGRVNAATRTVLAANGYAVKGWAGQRCCGALHAHAGDLEGARRLARANIAAFERCGADVVCTNAAGCGAALEGVAELLRDDPEWADRARAFSARVCDVSELLAAAGPRPGGVVRLRVAYDPPCHLVHAQRVDGPVRTLLDAIPGLEVVAVPDGGECCGGAGIYGLTHPDLGGAIGADKVTAVLGTGADLVATGNPGCMMQIGAGLLRAGSPVRAVHPVELLAESYRRLPPAALPGRATPPQASARPADRPSDDPQRGADP